MAEWIDIPSHRVHVVTVAEFLQREYEALDADGNVVDLQKTQNDLREPIMYRRVRDGILFRKARVFGSVHLVTYVAALVLEPL